MNIAHSQINTTKQHLLYLKYKYIYQKQIITTSTKFILYYNLSIISKYSILRLFFTRKIKIKQIFHTVI